MRRNKFSNSHNGKRFELSPVPSSRYNYPKIMIAIISLILALFAFAKPIYAMYDPVSVPNNKYGIHIVDTNDIFDLPPLVNSSGGDWGYVTLVLSDAERDPDRWQNIFDHLRRLLLIPIIRLATHVE